MVARAAQGHGFAHLGQFGVATGQRVGGIVLIHRRWRQAFALGPDAIEQVDVGAQARAHALQRLAQLLGRAQAQHLAIHGQRRTCAQPFGEPVHMRSAARGVDLHQCYAAAQELAFGLRPVAAVRKQRGLLPRDDQRAHRPSEARQPLPTLPARWQVLGDMRVARWHQAGAQAEFGQGLLCAGDAAGIDGLVSAHGGLPRGVSASLRREAWDCRDEATAAPQKVKRDPETLRALLDATGASCPESGQFSR